jgi:2-dehydropantoate 2-reductase
MRIVVMGAGGLGAYFGARLAAAGNDVAFVARGAHLAAMRRDGLVVRSARGDLHLKNLTATDDPASLTPPDIVLFAVKLWDTESAGRQIKPLVRSGTAVISFQNGVQKEEVLAGILSAGAVMGGTSQIGVAIERPGVIAHVGTMAKLTFGEMDGSRSSRAEAFLQACETAGVDAELTGDIQLRLWEKFVFLAAVSGCTTAMRQTIGPIRTNSQTRAFLLDLMREVVVLGRARGIGLPEDHAEQRLAFIDGLPETMTSSMQVDLSRGNKLEVPWLSGAVAELAKQSGTAAPLNRAVADILAPYANGAPQPRAP